MFDLYAFCLHVYLHDTIVKLSWLISSGQHIDNARQLSTLYGKDVATALLGQFNKISIMVL